MRDLTMLLAVCLIASGCKGQKDTTAILESGSVATNEDGSPREAVVPDVASEQQEGLTKRKAFDDNMGFFYDGTVTLSGEYGLVALDFGTAEQFCFAPDAASAKKLPDTESNGSFCFSNEAEARRLLKIKPVQWDKLPKNVCQATGKATIEISDYEDWANDGDGTDLARLKGVTSTSEQKLSTCDWIPIDEESDGDSAPSAGGATSRVNGESGKWPAKTGVYIASSSASIPDFPEQMEGYKSAASSSGKIRVFEGNEWTGLSDNQPAMNSCGDSMWMVRWRSANAVTVKTSTYGSRIEDIGEGNEGSTHGYMFGYRCEQPAFKFGHSGNATNLVDVYYELMEWNAAP